MLPRICLLQLSLDIWWPLKLFLEYVIVLGSELGSLLQNAAIGLLSVIGCFIIQTSIRETQPVVPADTGMLAAARNHIAASRCNRSKHMFVIMSMCIAGLIKSHCQSYESDEPNQKLESDQVSPLNYERN